MSPSSHRTALSGAALAALAAIAMTLAGCAPAALTAARTKLAAGQYAEARADLLTVKARQGQLSPSERREVDDGICLSEFMIGRPTYSLAEQHRACAEAAAQRASQSADLLARIDAQMRAEAAQEVEASLKMGDLAPAEEAARQYRATAGADPNVVAGWASRMWKIADREAMGRAHPIGKKKLRPLVAQLRRTHADVRKMNDDEFERWIRQTATVGKMPLVGRMDLRNDGVKLWIDEANAGAAARNLDRFTTINDAMVARCGCDARTDVGIDQSGFPIYLVRLDPDTRMSEVLILPGGELSERDIATALAP
jgi:hypothetical protein